MDKYQIFTNGVKRGLKLEQTNFKQEYLTAEEQLEQVEQNPAHLFLIAYPELATIKRFIEIQSEKGIDPNQIKSDVASLYQNNKFAEYKHLVLDIFEKTLHDDQKFKLFQQEDFNYFEPSEQDLKTIYVHPNNQNRHDINAYIKRFNSLVKNEFDSFYQYLKDKQYYYALKKIIFHQAATYPNTLNILDQFVSYTEPQKLEKHLYKMEKQLEHEANHHFLFKALQHILPTFDAIKMVKQKPMNEIVNHLSVFYQHNPLSETLNMFSFWQDGKFNTPFLQQIKKNVVDFYQYNHNVAQHYLYRDDSMKVNAQVLSHIKTLFNDDIEAIKPYANIILNKLDDNVEEQIHCFNVLNKDVRDIDDKVIIGFIKKMAKLDKKQSFNLFYGVKQEALNFIDVSHSPKLIQEALKADFYNLFYLDPKQNKDSIIQHLNSKPFYWGVFQHHPERNKFIQEWNGVDKLMCVLQLKEWKLYSQKTHDLLNFQNKDFQCPETARFAIEHPELYSELANETWETSIKKYICDQYKQKNIYNQKLTQENWDIVRHIKIDFDFITQLTALEAHAVLEYLLKPNAQNKIDLSNLTAEAQLIVYSNQPKLFQNPTHVLTGLTEELKTVLNKNKTYPVSSLKI